MKTKLLILLSCVLIATRVVAESTETVSVTFKDFPAGTSYAENEKHDLGGGLVIYTTLCHFTEQLRIYSSSTYNGYVISDPLSGSITNMSFRMGFQKDVLNVYGSTDKENWVLVKGIETTSTSYKDYTLNFPVGKGYTCFKLDVKGEQQIRIESMSVTYISTDDDNNEGTESGGDDNDGDVSDDDVSDDDKEEDSEEGSENDDEQKEEVVVVSAPIFNPVSTSFSTASLDVTIEAAEGCEIYYTKDGSTPSYVSAEEYSGTKGNSVSIYSSESKVTLQAIAVDPTTGKCSNVSSATYTYVQVKNDGSKTRPYTVAELRAMYAYGSIVKDKWVRGTICGAVNSSNNNLVTSDITIESNIAIGDEETFVAVELPDKNAIRKEVNLKAHPYMLGKEILVKGNLEQYLMPKGVGVMNTADYEVYYDVPINSYGYATLYLDMPVEIPTKSVVYYCVTEGSHANFLPIKSVIPDSMGVVLESEPNSTCRLVYTTEVNADEDAIREDNQLVGTTKDLVVEVDGNAYYALNVKNNELGFYVPQTAKDAEDAASGFTAKANKAYLKVPAEQKVSAFHIRSVINGETSVLPISNTSDCTVYDLQGRVVTCPSSGIYIQDGKKVVIR